MLQIALIQVQKTARLRRRNGEKTMASMRDIKRRRESVQSTGQITKAMKLVSSVKLQKAKVGAEVSKPYFDVSKVFALISPALSINNILLKIFFYNNIYPALFGLTAAFKLKFTVTPDRKHSSDIYLL